MDQLPGLADAPVQIDRSQHGLHRVRLDGGTVAAAAALLPLAQFQVAAQVQGLGHLHQAALAHQGRPDAGQVPLGQVRPGAVEVVCHHETQNRVPQKLQPLVAGHPLLPVLVGIGAVGQGVFQQRGIAEGVADLLFQGLHGVRSFLYQTAAPAKGDGGRQAGCAVIL